MKTRSFYGLDSVNEKLENLPEELNFHFKFVSNFLGDNIRVLDWIIRRVNGENIAEPSPVGYLPKKGSIDLQGLNVDWDKLMSLPKLYWTEDIEETFNWLDGQLGDDLPKDIRDQIQQQKERIHSYQG